MWASIALAMALLCAPVAGQRPLERVKVLYEDRGRGWAYAEIAVDAGLWNEDQLPSLCEDLLGEFSHATLVQARLYRGEPEPPVGLPPAPADFEDHLRFRNRMAEPRYAELLKIGGDSLLRFMTPEGVQVRRLIAGRDPARLRAGEETVDIVFLGGFRVPEEPALKIFALTDAPLTLDLARSVADAIRGRLPLEVRIYIRNDLWFFSPPYVHPFLPQGEPPSPADWDRTTTIYCPRQSTTTNCYLEQRIRAF